LQIVKEIQRRNVFRVTIGYVVSTWLLIQVADVVLENIGSPDWVMQTIMLVLALGFPIVVFFSWAYEVTPEGIKRESEIDRSDSITHVTGRKLDRAITVVLVLAVGYFAYNNYLLSNALDGEVAETVAQAAADQTAAGMPIPESAAPEPGKSVAVLPFVNMSGDESSAYFSDGLADTVLHMLAQVTDLRVAARTSSFQFRDQALGIAEIGRQLNVSSILEGSVQKSGDKIRVTAQLIDVSNGFHLWSGNFDRDLNDVFAIQDEIAAEVVAALKLSLLGESTATLASDRTDNLDAYTEYLLGVDRMSSIGVVNLNTAIEHMQQAIRIDPQYARAHSTLGRAYLDLAGFGGMNTEQAIAAARQAAERALDLDSTSSEALVVLGRAATQVGDLEQAGKLLGKAVEMSPNDVRALIAYTRYLRRPEISRFDEALIIGRKMQRIDPLSEYTNGGLGVTLWALGRYDEALDVFERFLLIEPDSIVMREYISGVNRAKGDFALYIAGYIAITERFPDEPDPEYPYSIGQSFLALDMPDEATIWFDRAIEIDPQHPVSRAIPLLLDYYWQRLDDDSFRLARELLDARIDNRATARLIALDVLTNYGAATDRHDIVLDTLDNLYPHLFDDPPRDLDPLDIGTLFTGLALINSGDVDRGLYLLNTVDENLAPSRSARGVRLGDVIFALGDPDKAATRFAEYVQNNPSRLGAWYLFFERAGHFDVLREDPVFVDYLEGSRELADEQRQLLQAMLEDSPEQ